MPLASRNFPFVQSTCELNSQRNGYPKSAQSCPKSNMKNCCFMFLPPYVNSSWHECVICPALLFDPSTLYIVTLTDCFSCVLTRLITILAVYETARAYPGITPYVYFSIYFI